MASNPQIVNLPNTLDTTPLAEIYQGLQKPPGQRTFPTILLYDERGLRLYDDITTKVSEYYLFAAEEQILRDNGTDVVRLMHGGLPVRNGEVVLELGAGALRKTSHLLRSLAQVSPISSQPSVTYLALDLEKRELERTLSLISSSELGSELTDRVRIGGLCGTYDDGIAYVRGGGLNEMYSSPLLKTQFLPPNQEGVFAESAVRPILSTQMPIASKEDSDGQFNGLPQSLSSDATLLSNISANAAPPSPQTPTDSQSTYSSDYEETPPIHFLFLGSSIGNFTREGAADFLRSLPLRPWVANGGLSETGSIGDTLLLGLDHDNSPDLIELAYNDPAGYTRDFIMNGLAGVRKALKEGHMPPEASSAFENQNWEYQEQYNTSEQRHEGRYLCKSKQNIMLGSEKITIEEGETIHIEHSYKYSESAAQELFNSANLKPIHRWVSANGLYSLWLLHRPSFHFPIMPQISASNTVGIETPSPFELPGDSRFPTIPTLDEWAHMWKLWDAVTLGMIPPGMLMQKPIDLRHKCLFYLGHIPTFLDIHLSRLLKEPHTEPDNFKYIFERGIDPHVEDPTQCHPHSEVPEADSDWPSLESILSFRDRVRDRLHSIYSRMESGELVKAGIPLRKAHRVVWMTFEHEAFHVETLLYMLIQKAGEEGGTRPPQGIPPPDWKALSLTWERRKENEKQQETVLTLGPAEIWLGHDDNEEMDTFTKTEPNGKHEFGWDNEHPKRKSNVGKFKIERKPVSNGDYHTFWKPLNKPAPASWVVKNDQIFVRTLFGLVPSAIAQDWPLIASYDEINAYAQQKGGRIPTEVELRLFMDDQASRGNSHVNNNAGWGYQRWWFEPPSLGNPERKEAPHNGGVWEWTSTLMDRHEGYRSSILYPGYSSDFFDNCHHVVLGGSFATIPRLAQRRSLRNFYQHNYPYAWIGARIAYDA